ncbi:NADH-quinone oxidoreductase subunit NuoG [Neptunicella sp. SCSIO 80796]|uniref:NADH-quinone oxidoreductase subunit NuoG n=1 Tax=Neptunicella plasticusilytica TaxID=3117012 RepID=UPI003A4DA685
MMTKIFIDNQQYEVTEGQNLLQACLSLKKDLPYFCWHPAMGSVGACRQCAMTQYQDEKDTRGKLIVACMTPVSEGMRVSMNQRQETEFRENVISALMTHHPHDCPVCAEGGECHLQDMTVMTGHYKRGFKGKKTTFPNQELGPLIKHEMNRCITCYRCERFYKDYAGGKDLAAQASKNHVYFGRQCDGTLESEFAGNLVEVCPTGVFTDKPFGDHYARKWDIQAAPSICQHCSVGCNITLSERYGSVRRVTNRFNDHLNSYFLCDRGRFGFDFVNSPQRRQTISLDGQDTRWSDTELQNRLKDKGKWIGVGSSQASLEDNFALQQLVGAENFCAMPDAEQEKLLELHMAILQQWPQASLAQIEQADAVLILGEDINNSAPRIALSVRQALLNNAKQQAEKLRVPRWQDAAVRQILPHNKVPLAILGYGDNALVEQASLHIVGDQKQTAEQGFLLANLLNDHAPTPRVQKVEEGIKQLAGILRQAKRPLIVSGWSANHSAILAAAANIRRALHNEQAMICIVPPEGNMLGLGMLAQGAHLTANELANQVDKNQANLLVLDHYSVQRQHQIGEWQKSANHLIRLSQLAEPLKKEINLPVTSFSESSGTSLNYQGLLQSWLPAASGSGQSLPAWQWLVNMAKLQDHPLGEINDLGQLRSLISATYLHFDQHWQQTNQQQIAMQSPRYSGRTAMLANQTVHEPKPFNEINAPYKHSMEGLLPGQKTNGQDNDNPLAYSWAPGWNSNQSNHKFRDEYRSAELKAQQGVFCVTEHSDSYWFKWQASWSSLSKANWKLLPLQKVFGSDSLSMQAVAIQQMAQQAQIVIAPKQAAEVELQNGQWVSCDDDKTLLQVSISDNVPANCALVYVPADQLFNLTECEVLIPASSQKVTAHNKRLSDQRQRLQVEKAALKSRLMTQDQHIPIQFIEGAI